MKKKKLFYVPGLLSLLGLPVLLFLFPAADPVFHNSIKMNLPEDDMKQHEKDGVLRFNKEYLQQGLAGKKVERIYLNEHSDYYSGDIERYSLNRKLAFIGNEMERLQFTHDTSTVLQVSFGNESTYGQFIYLLNLTILNRFRRYALYDNDLYFFPNPPPLPPSEVEVNEFPLLDIGPAGNWAVPSITKWDIFLWNTECRLWQFKYEVTDNPILCSGFLILIGVPFVIHLFVKKRKKQLSHAQTVV